jgi:5'(3')-deoxyribonucleotidase
MAEQVIAVDLDGVVYEWDRTARYMLRTFRGLTHLNTPSSSWDHIQQNCGLDDWHWLWTEGVKRGLFRYGHMMTGARIALDELSDRYGLVVVTHRPSSAVMDTVEWMSLYFKDIPLRGLHILSNGEPKTNVNADILIDDKPENLVAWADAGRRSIQFVQPHNRAWLRSDIQRADGWEEVSGLLL